MKGYKHLSKSQPCARFEPQLEIFVSPVISHLVAPAADPCISGSQLRNNDRRYMLRGGQLASADRMMRYSVGLAESAK